jgi:hypothetical protein
MRHAFQTALFTSTKVISAVTLGGAIFWQVATHCGPHMGTVYVHVTAAEVNVVVDSATYHVESACEPALVCELRPGRHTLQMTRGDEVLFQQDFTVERGKSIILMPYEQSAPVLAYAPVLALSANEPQPTSRPAREIPRAHENRRQGCIFPR